MTSIAIGTKLVHAVTLYDRQQEAFERRKGYVVNIYRLGILFKAVDHVRAEIDKGKSVRAALLNNFNGRLLDRCLKAVGESKFTREEMFSQSICRRED